MPQKPKTRRGFWSRLCPVTKCDLKAMEDRLMVAIQNAGSAQLEQLTQQLRKGTDSLEAAVKKDQTG